MSRRSGEVVDVMVRKRIYICCVPETRWRGGSARWMGRKGERYKFFWKGNEEGICGVGVLLAERLTDHVVGINRVNERIMVVKLLSGKRLVNILSVYAPQTGRPRVEKDTFWDTLVEVVSRIPSGELVILGGDLNGHVGATAAGYEGVHRHGGMGTGSRNGDDDRILEFGDATELVLCNTFFKKKEEQLVTYSSGGCNTAIDFIMVRKSDRAMVTNVKVIASEECVQQHRLLVADMKLSRGQRMKQKHVPWFREWKLSQDKVRIEFTAKVKSMVEEAGMATDVEGRWTTLKEILMKSTEYVCGWTKDASRHRETWWWNNEVKRVVDEKRKSFRRWKTSEDEGDHAA